MKKTNLHHTFPEDALLKKMDELTTISSSELMVLVAPVLEKLKRQDAALAQNVKQIKTLSEKLRTSQNGLTKEKTDRASSELELKLALNQERFVQNNAEYELKKEHEKMDIDLKLTNYRRD